MPFVLIASLGLKIEMVETVHARNKEQLCKPYNLNKVHIRKENRNGVYGWCQ